jgi:hypothetical protein
MSFPSYVHAVVDNPAREAWPVQAQGVNECGVTSPANAMNLVLGQPRFDKEALLRAAGVFFRRSLGGSPSFVTEWLLRGNGFGTHFGNLSQTDGEAVLRDLIDRKVPVVVELWANKIAGFTLFGLHSVVLVGYSDPYTDATGQRREEYYVVDAQYPALGNLDLAANDADRNGDGVPEVFPGNRTFERAEFRQIYPTGIYFPVFRSQAEHDAWYVANMEPVPRLPVLGPLADRYVTGRIDRWRGTPVAVR